MKLRQVVRKQYKNGFFVDLPYGYQKLADNGWYGNSEIETQDWMIDHVKPDWVCLDIGAHIGYYAMLMSSLAHQGKVYAVEPYTKTNEMMRLNVEYNHTTHGYTFTNIEYLEVAVGHRTGGFTETVWVTDGDKGDYGEQELPLKFVTLDFLCTEILKLQRLDLIKTDTDGWDYEVLLGAKGIAEKFHPFIVAEANYALKWRDHSPKEFYFIAESYGYQIMPLDAACPGNCLLY